MSGLKTEAAKEKAAQAKHKVQEVLKFREEIEEEVIDLVKRQEAIKDKFLRRIHGKKNRHGYLMQPSDKYQSSMGDFDNDLFQTLLHEDLMHWEALSKGTTNR